jgi:methionine-S-sulfoxide reductase
VCSGNTGHAEIVEIKYDPTVISTTQLMKTFFSLHDPTMDARNYRGGQYRSAVYFTSPEQEKEVRDAIKHEQTMHKRPIVTEIAAAPTFWRAEEYHQMYYAKNKSGVCSR